MPSADVEHGSAWESICLAASTADGAATEVRLDPRLVTDDLTTLREAALQGVGIAMLPFSLIRKDLSDRKLVQLLPQLELPSGLVHAVFPSRRGLVPAVRALIDALAEGFADGGTGPERLAVVA